MPKPVSGRKRQKKNLGYAERNLQKKKCTRLKPTLGMGNYKAARVSAKRVLDEYPKLGFDTEANDLLKKIKDK